MLAAGINVCLGTDSLASNSSLSILDEMRFFYRPGHRLSPATILRMATLNGAVALNWHEQIGSIVPGKQADLIAIPLADTNRDPSVDILESTKQPCLTLVNGRIVYQDT